MAHDHAVHNINSQVTAEGKKVRYLVKTGEEVPDRSFDKSAPAKDEGGADGGAAPSA